MTSLKTRLIVMLALVLGLAFSAVSMGEITTPGVTAEYIVRPNINHTFVYTITGINTNVVVRAEGFVRNSGNAFNMNDSNLDTTHTANGTYMMHKSNFDLYSVKFRFVSESGGTTATINVYYDGK